MKPGYLRVLPCSLFLAAIFGCTPAFGLESGSYIDSPNGEIVSGYSYVELDYTEDWEYSAELLVSSSALYDPDGNVLDSSETEVNTDEDTYAESDVSGVNGPGEYSVIGDSQMYFGDGGETDGGETSDGMEFSDQGGGGCGDPPGCILPDTDTSVYLNPSPDQGHTWAALFAGYATLSTAGGYPQNTWANLLGAMAGNGFTFGGNSDYKDAVGVSNFAFNQEEYGGWPNIPCGFFVYQDMWVLCPNNNVWTNYYVNNDEVDVWPDGAGGLVYDQRADAYVYYGN